MMIFAGIDIGSNAVRILFSEVFEGENGELVSSKMSLIRVPLRLGEDVFTLGYIKEETIENLVDTLLAFKQMMKAYKTLDYDICATSAMREAQNSKEVIERVETETGIRIRVIDGLEEADIIRLSGERFPEAKYDYSLFVDVGGGSTELSFLKGGSFISCESFRLGTLRLLHKAEDPNEYTRLNNWLKQFEKYFGNINLFGSGGNINRLTKLFGDSNGSSIKLSKLHKGYKKLSAMSVQERMEKYKLRADRADVIIPAAEIFLSIASKIESEKIIVPRFGLADGLVCALYLKHRRG